MRPRSVPEGRPATQTGPQGPLGPRRRAGRGATGAILAASSAAGDLNVAYKGTGSFDGKDVPVEAHYSITAGRVAVVEQGAHGGRILFLQKEGILRMVDDAHKSYFDLDQAKLEQLHSTVSDAQAKMDEAMAQMSPEQRKMMAGMMANGPSAGARLAVEHVKSAAPTSAPSTGARCRRIST